MSPEKDDESGAPPPPEIAAFDQAGKAKWVPKVGERVVVFATVREIKGPFKRTFNEGRVRTIDTAFEFTLEVEGGWVPRADPVPLFRELILSMEESAKVTGMSGRENQAIEKVRAAYPNTFEEEKR